jgi:hypothetical protein
MLILHSYVPVLRAIPVLLIIILFFMYFEKCWKHRIDHQSPSLTLLIKGAEKDTSKDTITILDCDCSPSNALHYIDSALSKVNSTPALLFTLPSCTTSLSCVYLAIQQPKTVPAYRTFEGSAAENVAVSTFSALSSAPWYPSLSPDIAHIEVVCKGYPSIAPYSPRYRSSYNHTQLPFTLYTLLLDESELTTRVAAASTKGPLKMHCVLSALVEHRAWTWNAVPVGLPPWFPSNGLKEVGTPNPVYFPIKVDESSVAVEKAVGVEVSIPPKDAKPPLKVCSWLDGADGSWVHSQERPSGSLGPASFGYWWKPTTCTFDPLPTREFALKCIGGDPLHTTPVLHLLGDSNTRRHFKDLWGRLGDISPWCPPASYASHVCQCEDATSSDDPEANADVTVRAIPGGGFLVRAWLQGLGNPSQVASALSSTKGAGCPPPAQKSPPESPPCPRAVVVSLGMWDSAWQSTEHYSNQLDAFLPALLEAYPDNRTLIVLRTPNHQCCAKKVRDSREDAMSFANSGRVTLHAALTRHKFHAFLEGSGRLRVWDVFAMGAARPLDMSSGIKAGCQVPHEPSQEVALENDYLLTALCGE